MTDLKETLITLLAESEILSRTPEINSTADIKSRYRNLGKEEIEQLKKQNNHAENWDRIYVAEGFITSFISGNRFHGECHLGRFTGFPLEVDNEISFQSGIYDSIIKDSVIEDESLVCRCGLVANYIISSYTVLYNISTITASKENTFANGNSISAGPETGERSVEIFAEMNMQIAGSLLLPASRAAYNEFIKEYRERCALKTGFAGKNCRIINTNSISNTFIGDMAVISGASGISGSMLLSSESDQTFIGSGAVITDSIVQWGCAAESGAIIHRSLLMEYSHAEKNCVITESIIGPNSSIGEAEITSSFAGPFTAAHHHSLLIAAVWPGGRGNIGYGANVGSNHTSRLPDQELIPGEGMFFGLGSSIKFPADYRNSPYTVISTGAVTLPQRVEFPFSLITQQSASYTGISPQFNELMPGWVLGENIYSVVRNESKYRKRNRGHRNSIDFNIFRPEIIDMMISARDRLKNVDPVKDIYTDADIKGAGKNIITERGRTEGIEAYTFYIKYYALRVLAHRAGKVLSGNQGIDKSVIFEQDSDIKEWTHAMNVLETEGLKELPLDELLKKLTGQNNVLLSAVYSSKERDYTRGCRIIDDYAQFHRPAGDDPFVIELKNRVVIEQTRLEQIIKML